MGSTLPLCRWPLCPGFAVFLRRIPSDIQKNRPTTPLFEFGLPPGALPGEARPALVSFTHARLFSRGTRNLALARRGQPLSWALVPYSTSGPAGPLIQRRFLSVAALNCGFASPATLRPQGLVTLSPSFSPQGRAGLVSCRRRSWDLPFGAFSSAGGSPDLSNRTAPAYRFSAAICPSKEFERPARGSRGFRVLTPTAESLAVGRVFNTSVAGCSPGFSALQGTPARTLPGISPRLLPRAWLAWALPPELACVSEYRSIPARPHRQPAVNDGQRTGQPS